MGGVRNAQLTIKRPLFGLDHIDHRTSIHRLALLARWDGKLQHEFIKVLDCGVFEDSATPLWLISRKSPSQNLNENGHKSNQNGLKKNQTDTNPKKLSVCCFKNSQNGFCATRSGFSGGTCQAALTSTRSESEAVLRLLRIPFLTTSHRSNIKPAQVLSKHSLFD